MFVLLDHKIWLPGRKLNRLVVFDARLSTDGAGEIAGFLFMGTARLSVEGFLALDVADGYLAALLLDEYRPWWQRAICNHKIFV